jgi:hypothetical protein
MLTVRTSKCNTTTKKPSSAVFFGFIIKGQCGSNAAPTRFGQPPMRDVKALRQGKAVQMSAA